MSTFPAEVIIISVNMSDKNQFDRNNQLGLGTRKYKTVKNQPMFVAGPGQYATIGVFTSTGSIIYVRG